MAYFSIHFDGDITNNHKLPVRVLGKTYSCMQSAIDRSHLINTYGNVWKYAKLKSFQYPEAEFIAHYPREGGIWLDTVKAGAEAVIDKINSTIAPLYERAQQQGVDDAGSFLGQIAERKEHVDGMRLRVPIYQEWQMDKRDEWASAYSSRSVAKEIDQLVSQVSAKHLHNSTVQIQLMGSRPYPIYEFDSVKAKRFHRIVSLREVGPAVRLRIRVTVLDRGFNARNPSAKAVNLANNREFALYIVREGGADDVHQIHDNGQYEIYAAPVMEANGFDVNRGDYVFLGIVNG